MLLVEDQIAELIEVLELACTTITVDEGMTGLGQDLLNLLDKLHVARENTSCSMLQAVRENKIGVSLYFPTIVDVDDTGQE